MEDIRSKGEALYQVQKNRSTVSFKALKQKNAKSIKIPEVIKQGGNTYKVTSIAANAFNGCKKLKTVTIGKNITVIGNKAFFGCGKLVKLTIKSTSLKKVGSNALKGTSKKLVVKVPKGKKRPYTKLLKAKGNKKITVK